MFQDLDGEGFVFLTYQFWLNSISNCFVDLVRSRCWYSRLILKKNSEEKFLVKEIHLKHGCYLYVWNLLNFHFKSNYHYIFSLWEDISLIIQLSFEYFSLVKLIAEIYAHLWTLMSILDKQMQYLDAEHRILARLCAVAVLRVNCG